MLAYFFTLPSPPCQPYIHRTSFLRMYIFFYSRLFIKNYFAACRVVFRDYLRGGGRVPPPSYSFKKINNIQYVSPTIENKKRTF